MSKSYHAYYTVEKFEHEKRLYTKFVLPSGECVIATDSYVQDWVAQHPTVMLENALVMLTQHRMRIAVEDTKPSNQTPS